MTKQMIISWTPFIVLIIMWAVFMKLQAKAAENQKRLLEGYINRSADQLERLAVAAEEKISGSDHRYR